MPMPMPMPIRKRTSADQPIFIAALLMGIGALLVTSLIVMILGATATGILAITTTGEQTAASGTGGTTPTEVGAPVSPAQADH